MVYYTTDDGFDEGRSNDDMIELGSETKCAFMLV